MDAIDTELLAKNGWAVGFLITSLQLMAFVMAGYLWLTVHAFRKGETSIGVIFTILLVIIGGGWTLGVVLGLIVGWTKARRWQIRGFMAGWTTLILLALINLAISAVMRKMSMEDWREWFGWLPGF